MTDKLKFRVWDCIACKYQDDYFIGQNGLLYAQFQEDISIVNHIPLTIEECTGLKDTNGKLIYDGDILFGREEGNGETTAWSDVYKTVFYHDDYARWCVMDKNGHKDWWDDLSDYNNDYEIISNIHKK